MNKRNEQVLDRMTSANLSPVFMIPLDQIKQFPEDYRHRDEADLDPNKPPMQALMNSLITDGQKDPVIVYKVVAKDGSVSFVLVAGHRRLLALKFLAQQNVAGFSLYMDVKACEILDGNRHDYLLWSVADNVMRQQIDEHPSGQGGPPPAQGECRPHPHQDQPDPLRLDIRSVSPPCRKSMDA